MLLSYEPYDKDKLRRNSANGKLVIEVSRKPPRPRIQFDCKLCMKTLDAFGRWDGFRKHGGAWYPGDVCKLCVNEWNPKTHGTGINGAYADHKVLRVLRSITCALESGIKNGKRNVIRTV